MDIRTKREKSFDRLVSFVTKNITDPDDGDAALNFIEELYNKKGADPNADNGGHAHTIPGIKTMLMNNEKFSKYFVKPSKIEAARAKYAELKNKKDTP